MRTCSAHVTVAATVDGADGRGGVLVDACLRSCGAWASDRPQICQIICISLSFIGFERVVDAYVPGSAHVAVGAAGDGADGRGGLLGDDCLRVAAVHSRIHSIMSDLQQMHLCVRATQRHHEPRAASTGSTGVFRAAPWVDANVGWRVCGWQHRGRTNTAVL